MSFALQGGTPHGFSKSISDVIPCLRARCCTGVAHLRRGMCFPVFGVAPAHARQHLQPVLILAVVGGCFKINARPAPVFPRAFPCRLHFSLLNVPPLLLGVLSTVLVDLDCIVGQCARHRSFCSNSLCILTSFVNTCDTIACLAFRQ